MRYLRTIGDVSVDELALEFDEAMNLIWIPLETGDIIDEQLVGAHKVDELLLSFSGRSNADKWTEDALATSEEWRRVRAAAKEALKTLPVGSGSDRDA